MILHRVRPGETVDSISQLYGVPASRIIAQNGLSEPFALAVGQTLVILFAADTYTVEQGDTLYSIAENLGVPVNTLLADNPQLGGVPTIYPGQTLNVGFTAKKLRALRVNGYAYPFIDREVLRRTLPYLTYLTIFTYGFTPDGSLIVPDDRELIDLALSYSTAPVMLISTLGEDGKFSNQLARDLLESEAVQETLIGNILMNMREKGYTGLDVDFEYVPTDLREAYTAFITKVSERLNAEGYQSVISLAPKTSADQPGLLYEAHDYAALGNAADSALLMTYEWGFTYGPPMAVAPLDKVEKVVDFAVSQIPTEKLFMGMPNYGYDWTLPFVSGESKAESLSNTAAVARAVEAGAEIEFDETAQSPFFRYTRDGSVHEVWFEDAFSVQAKLGLITEKGLRGVSVWNIMRYFPQMWAVMNALYNIEKII